MGDLAVGDLAVQTVSALSEHGRSVAVAESLTGGLVLAALTDVPGASAVVRGGAVVYATDTKRSLLGVDAGLLASRGPVDPEVAVAMARGVRLLFASEIGLATTGVAGPDPQEGHPVGEVYVAVADGVGEQVRPLRLTGQRDAIRRATVQAGLELLLGCVVAVGR